MQSIIFYTRPAKGFLYGVSHDHKFVDWHCPYAKYHLEKLTSDKDYQEMFDKAKSYLQKNEIPYLIERMQNLTT